MEEQEIESAGVDPAEDTRRAAMSMTQAMGEQQAAIEEQNEEAVALPPVMAEIQGPVPQEIAQAIEEVQVMPEAEYESSTPRPEGLPEPDEGEIIMTRSELGRSRKPWIKEAKFRIYTQRSAIDGFQEGWWCQGFNGYCSEKVEAGLESYEKVMTLNTSSAYWLYVVDPTIKIVEKPVDPRGKRKCNMATLLGTTIVSMMKLSPKNETFRAKLMATVGEMPPKDCDTFEKIKDWVEFNFPKTNKEIQKEPLRLRVTFRETESGRCNYTRTQNAVASVRITEADFAKALDDAGDDPYDFDEVVSNLSEIVEEKAQENNEYTDTKLSTSDEEADDTQNDDYDYSYSTMKSHLLEYLRLNHPEVAEEMGLM